LNASAFALRQLGRFSKARRLCTQGLHIGEVIEDPAATAESHYVLGTIQWIIGNTAEASTHLRIAREMFEDQLRDVVGAARVRRYEGFLYYRIGNLAKSIDLLEEARACFEEHEKITDLAEVLAVQSRVLFEAGRYEQARQLVEQANEIAREIGNNYVLAETLINLYTLNSRERSLARESGDPERAARYSHVAQQCLQEGAEIAQRFKYNLLISVYEKIAGDIAFDEGNLGQAFEHYVAALEHGAKFEYARLHRTLDPCVDRLVQLPANQIRYYADYVIREWKARGLDTEFPDVVNTFELIKEYREYVSQA
jgi:tetratricopeptide (TPR) repeat protein